MPIRNPSTGIDLENLPKWAPAVPGRLTQRPEQSARVGAYVELRVGAQQASERRDSVSLRLEVSHRPREALESGFRRLSTAAAILERMVPPIPGAAASRMMMTPATSATMPTYSATSGHARSWGAIPLVTRMNMNPRIARRRLPQKGPVTQLCPWARPRPPVFGSVKAYPRAAKAGRSLASVCSIISGRTLVSPTTGMKLVSPPQRGTTCM